MNHEENKRKGNVLIRADAFTNFKPGNSLYAVIVRFHN